MPKETPEEIDEIMRSNKGVSLGKEKESFVADHTGYGKGGENFEHDNKGNEMNYSGVVDEVNNALKEHEDWQEGYDY